MSLLSQRLLRHRRPSLLRHLCTTNSATTSIVNPPNPRGRTPLENQFCSFLTNLTPNSDIPAALRSVPDPDLALDLFRWTALRPNFRHSSDSHLAILTILVNARRFSAAESLVSDILAGACAPTLPLFNASIRFCCSRRHLFSTAFDLFKKMDQSPSSACRPDLDTFTMLLSAILRRFGKPPVCYVYLHSVRSLVRQMKSSGVVPDTFTLNLVIKAFAKCLEVDEAVRVFKELGIYGCEPNEYSYGYVAQAFCEKGRVEEGMAWFREMRVKGLVPKSSVYMTVICSLVLEGKFELGIEVLFDMLENKMAPDLLTYRTVLEGLCRDGKSDSAFELLEELSKRKGAMDRKMYSDLLDGLHWLCQPHDD